MKTFSTGGLGDFFIVSLKLREMRERSPKASIEHLHIESNLIVPELILETFCHPFGIGLKGIVNMLAASPDPLYEQLIAKGEFSDRTAIATSIDGKCDLHGQTMPLTQPFVDYRPDPYDFPTFDIAIQVAGGAKNSRKWKFSPLQLATFLRAKGFRVCLIGSDLDFANEADPDNFVGRTKLSETIAIVQRSGIVFSCSGLITYVALSLKKEVVHFEESIEHNKRYIHPKWEEYRMGIKQGALPEIISQLRKAGYQL